VPSGNSAKASRVASNEDRADKPLASLEIAFQKRLEQTRIQKQQEGSQGTKQNNGKSGISANFRSMLREGSQQQQNRNNGPPNRPNLRNNIQGNQSQSGNVNDRFRRQQQNNIVRPNNIAQQVGSQRNGQSNGAPGPHGENGETKQATSSAATIREMLAQNTSVGNARKPRGITSIADLLKGTAANANQQQRNPRTNGRNPAAPSIHDMLVQTAYSSSSEKKRDMMDVSNLREAFLKTIEKQKEQRAQERIQYTSSNQNRQASVQPAWRRDGAKGFRKRLQEQQREQMEKLEHQRRMRAAVNRSSGAFFMTQEDYIEDKR
jgi:hypothetical protein